MITISNRHRDIILQLLKDYIATPHDGTLRAVNARRMAKQMVSVLSAKQTTKNGR